MDGFRNRVATSTARVAQRDPAAFKSGLAEGMADVGETLGRTAEGAGVTKERMADSEARIAEIERSRRRAAQASAAQVALAEIEARAVERADAMRQAAKLGGVGHETEFGQWVDQEVETLATSLAEDPELLQQFAPSIARLSAGLKTGERRWEAGRRVELQKNNREAWRNHSANILLGTPLAELPAKLDEYREQARAGAELLDVDGTTRAAVLVEDDKVLTQAVLDAAIEQPGGAAAVKGWIEGGLFDAVIDPKDRKAYLRQVEIVEQQAARSVELEEKARQDEARDAMDAVEAKVAAGVVPTTEELRTVRAGAAAAGIDESDLIAFDALSVKVQINRNYGEMIGKPGGADRIRADRDRYAAIAKPSEADQMAKTQLDALVEAADKKEAEGLRELAKQGPAGMIAALGALTGTAEARYDRAEKIEVGLGFVAGLGPSARAHAIEGRDIRKARPKDFGEPKEAKQLLDRTIGPLAGALGGQYDDLLNTAWDIMAAREAANGRSGFSAQGMWLGIMMATGAQRRPDGSIQGGIQRVRDKPVHLPESLTAPEFDSALSRLPFADAVYGNGAVASKADILAHYRPQWLRDDDRGRSLYLMIDAVGGHLKHKSGRPYAVTIGQRK